MSKSASNLSRSPTAEGSPTSTRSTTLGQGIRKEGRNTWRGRILNDMGYNKGCLFAFVTSAAFELTVAVAIVANGVLMAVEAQYAGLGLAYDVGHASAEGKSEQSWQHAAETFDLLQVMFGVFFTIEIVLKVVGLRWAFVLEAWNWIDLAIVMLWLYCWVAQLAFHTPVLRLARLARLVRLLRLIKFMQSHLMESLFLMSTALSGSIVTTGWAFVFFFVVHAMLALFMNQVLFELYFDAGSAGSDQQIQVFQYFGSFSRAFITMFEITFDGWSLGVRTLVENVSEVFIIYAVLHKLVIGFAVVNVLGAVFIQETFEAAFADDNLVVRQQGRKERKHSERMQRLFQAADLDGGGSIDIDEWLAVCSDEWVQVWLRAQEIRAHDARTLFELIDNGDGEITADELVCGTSELRGRSATMHMMHTLRRLNGRVQDIMYMMASLDGVAKCVQDIRSDLLFPQPAVAVERM